MFSRQIGILKDLKVLKNLMADAIILQTAIENDATAVTSDKEWKRVKEAKVRVV